MCSDSRNHHVAEAHRLAGPCNDCFVIANVHFGIVAENVVEGAGSSRLDVLRLADLVAPFLKWRKRFRKRDRFLLE